MILKRILLAGGVCLRHTCMPCLVFSNYFPQRAVASWGILNRYWLDPKKSPKCFANLHGLNEVARQKEGYF